MNFHFNSNSIKIQIQIIFDFVDMYSIEQQLLKIVFNSKTCTKPPLTCMSEMDLSFNFLNFNISKIITQLPNLPKNML